MSPCVLEKVPDQLGYLVITDDGAVSASGGDLQNDENTASVMYHMVKSADKSSLLSSNNNESFKRLSIYYEDYMYSVCLSNRKIHVIKKTYVTTQPVTA
ncbi:Uncharacterised protein g1548 [Pycnogonum litorale]